MNSHFRLVYLFLFVKIYSNFRLEDMKDQLRKRMYKKRIVRKITFSIANGISIQLSSYALIRPTLPGICISDSPFFQLVTYSL